MAIIKCSECGKDVSDRASACPNCGCPIDEKGKLIVYGYTQTFLINPKVIIYLDDKEVGSVGNGDAIEIPIDKECEIKFKCALNTAKIIVPFGKVTKVKITWNRLNGQMIPKIIDAHI